MINTYAANNKAPKQMKQKMTELKRDIANSKIIAGDFKTLF